MINGPCSQTLNDALALLFCSCTQTCKWAFLIFSGTFVTSLAVSEDPVARRLAFHLVQSSFMRKFVGRWEVCAAPAPLSPGEQAGLAARGVHAAASVTRHSLSVRPSVSPPAAVAHYTSKIFVRQVCPCACSRCCLALCALVLLPACPLCHVFSSSDHTSPLPLMKWE